MIFSAVVVEFSFEPLVALLRKSRPAFLGTTGNVDKFAGKNNRSYDHSRHTLHFLFKFATSGWLNKRKAKPIT